MNNPAYKKVTLDNGLRIIMVPKSDSLSVYLNITVQTGTDYETKDINGISHFLEHMCFKGTTKRPGPIDIATEFEKIGAVYNASTSRERTNYWAKARPNHFDQILDILSDMYLNQLFSEKEIEKERGVIIEEINMYEDRPDSKVGFIFEELLYGDQPAGWTPTGPKETIQKISKNDFINYYKDHYVADATIVIIAGNFDEEYAVSKIKEFLSSINTKPKKDRVNTIEKQSIPQLKLFNKKTDQTNIVLGFRAFDRFDERRFAAIVLGEILGGGLSSRLSEKIREEMGAAYSIGSGASFAFDRGTLEIWGGINNDKLKDVTLAILDEIRKIKNEKVGEDELNKAKESIIGGMAISLETANQIASFYANQEIAKKEIMTPEEMIKKYEAVTTNDIMNVANDIFKNEGLNLAAVGPFEKDTEKEISEILKI